MMKRWKKHLNSIPKVDKDDLKNKNLTIKG
jgi:hypothetical protein